MIECECSKCKSKNVQVWSRITGYYQNVSGWNAAKLQELKDRRRYGVHAEPEDKKEVSEPIAVTIK
ncbi:MAG: anaerobic ribonucleoside-triphosphate reductase [Nanoarchaeota archaeon]|nr:anaerobic ribonucleoside-triphosphate reductase [Nanoarchaeota archaeon]